MQSQIVIPDAAPTGLDYVLPDLPHGIAAITHELMKHCGRAVAEEFLTRGVGQRGAQYNGCAGLGVGVRAARLAVAGRGAMVPRQLTDVS